MKINFNPACCLRKFAYCPTQTACLHSVFWSAKNPALLIVVGMCGCSGLAATACSMIFSKATKPKSIKTLAVESPKAKTIPFLQRCKFLPSRQKQWASILPMFGTLYQFQHPLPHPFVSPATDRSVAHLRAFQLQVTEQLTQILWQRGCCLHNRKMEMHHRATGIHSLEPSVGEWLPKSSLQIIAHGLPCQQL